MHLDQIITDPAKRKPVYQAFAAVGLTIGAVQVAYAAIPDLSQPVWLAAALSVYAFLAGAGFTVVQAHTNPRSVVDDPHTRLPGADVADPDTVDVTDDAGPEPEWDPAEFRVDDSRDA